jgi:hypothetical protein
MRGSVKRETMMVRVDPCVAPRVTLHHTQRQIALRRQERRIECVLELSNARLLGEGRGRLETRRLGVILRPEA